MKPQLGGYQVQGVLAIRVGVGAEDFHIARAPPPAWTLSRMDAMSRPVVLHPSAGEFGRSQKCNTLQETSL